MKKEKKTVIVEHRYIGQFKFDDWGTWNKWHAYRDLKTAESVVEQLTRKFGKSFEFRVKPPNTASTPTGGESTVKAASPAPAPLPSNQVEPIPPTSG